MKRIICPHCKKEFDYEQQKIKMIMEKLIPGTNVTELANEINCSRPTVYNWLKKLQNKNLIRLEKQYGVKGSPVQIYPLIKKK